MEPAPSVFDFELCELQWLDPRVLTSGDDKVDGLILGLTLAFNDLKNLAALGANFQKRRPVNVTEPDMFRGELDGVLTWINRVAASTLRELVDMIDAHRALFELPTLRAAIAAMPAESRQVFLGVIDLSAKKPKDDALLKFLVRVRSNSGFHYRQTDELLRGYRRHFFEAAKTATNTHAYVSLGSDHMNSRFFFADAAAQRYVHELEDHDGTQFKSAIDLLHRFNSALCFFLHRYLDARDAVIRRETASTAGG